MKRIVCMVSALLAIFMGGPSEAGEYTVGLMPRPGYASPFLVADTKGFFTEQGVTVTPTIYLTVQEYANAHLYDKKNLFCLWNSSHVGELLAEYRFISVGAMSYEQGTLKLITKTNLLPQDVITQKIGFPVDALAYRWLLWEYLKPENIDMTKTSVATLPFNELLSNFLAGRLNIVALLGNYADSAMKEGDGVVKTALTPQMSLGSLLMSETTYKTVPKDDLKRIWRALIQAIDWIHDPANAEEYLRILQEAFAEDPNWANITTVEALKETQTREKTIPAQELYFYNTSFLEEAYTTAKQVVTDMGQSADFTYKNVVDTTALLEVLEEMGLADTSEGSGIK